MRTNNNEHKEKMERLIESMINANNQNQNLQAPIQQIPPKIQDSLHTNSSLSQTKTKKITTALNETKLNGNVSKW